MIGFTGVNWDTRPTEQLAADLGAGPGPAPLAEAGLALEMAATATDISLTIHAHPTLGESMLEAAEAAHKQAIHIVNR